MKHGMYLSGVAHGEPFYDFGVAKRCWTYQRDPDEKLITIYRGSDEFCNRTLCIGSRLIGTFCFVTQLRLRNSTCAKCFAELGIEPPTR